MILGIPVTAGEVGIIHGIQAIMGWVVIMDMVMAMVTDLHIMAAITVGEDTLTTVVTTDIQITTATTTKPTDAASVLTDTPLPD